MKHKLLSGAASAALLLGMSWTDTARAQAVYDWTGFYVGLNAGGAWGRSHANTPVDCAPPSVTSYFCDSTGNGAGNAAAVSASGSGTISGSGFTGGIQAGYNWQINSLIYGLETDFGALHLRGSRQRSAIYPESGPAAVQFNSYTVGSSFDTDWMFTFRGRFGWAVQNNMMLFATAGLAATELKISNSFSDNRGVGASESASESKLKLGWVLGGGLEWALGNHWSVKAEYLYADFGKVTASGTILNYSPPPPNPPYAQGLSTSADLTAHIARIGVNYRF